MISTKYSGINQEQYNNLEKCFEKNKETYHQDRKSQSSEMRNVMVLISILPIMFLIFIIADGITNDKSIIDTVIENLVTGAITIFGFVGFMLVLSWGMVKSSKTKYNKKSLVKIFNDFVQLSLKSEKNTNKENNFYDNAMSGGVINGVTKSIQIDTYEYGKIKIQSDNIFTQEYTGKGAYTVDNCYVGKVSFPSEITDTSFSITENTTNSVKGILKRIFSSIYYSLLVIGVYYIFWVEKCETTVLGNNGCKNGIDLLGFFSQKYILLVVILAFLIFSALYMKTLSKKSYTKDTILNDKFDIFIYDGDVSNISKILEELKNVSKENRSVGKNFKFYMKDNYLYASVEKRTIIYDKNIYYSLYLSFRSGISKNTGEEDFAREYVNYVNFNSMLQKLGQDIISINSTT